MVVFLDGMITMGCAIAGLIFLRVWRQSRERLLLSFAIAFWIFAVSYASLGLVPLADERRPYVFLLRLIGFVVILAAIADKNWRSESGD